MIRLDSMTSLTPVEEFDPLKEPPTTVNHNAAYAYHVPPAQRAEPQRASSAVRPGPYTSLFDTGSDPFTNLLAFTRTNLGPTEQLPPKDVAASKSWTTFD